MNRKQITETINLLQGYYRFLYLGIFLENIIKEKDFSAYAKDIKIKTGPDNNFNLKKERIENLLKEIYKNPSKQNIFGYFIQLTMFRGISATTRELIERSKMFNDFLKKRLGKQYEPFEQIIKFTRNVLSHNINSEIILNKNDYHAQKLYLLYNNKHILNFNFKYSKHFPEYWQGDKTYGVDLKLNFKNIQKGDKFLEHISIHNLFLISELCYNISEIFKKDYKL